MSKIIAERRTADHQGDIVVFLIGMRVNRWWKVHKWWPVGMAMPKMLSELQQEPELGLLGFESWFGRTSIIVQYWKSVDHLMAYAKDPKYQHHPAWKRFNCAVASNGDVGIWHETYAVPAGNFECLYGNMPLFGLARATSSVPATGRREGACGRMAMSTET